MDPIIPSNGRVPASSPKVDCLMDSESERELHHEEVDFLKMERKIRSELMRFKLSHRAQNLALLICAESFNNLKDAICFQALQTFSDFTGISVPHVSTVLQALKTMRVIRIEEREGLTYYSVNTDSDTWQVAPRVSHEDIKRAKDSIRRFNDLPSTESL